MNGKHDIVYNSTWNTKLKHQLISVLQILNKHIFEHVFSMFGTFLCVHKVSPFGISMYAIVGRT